MSTFGYTQRFSISIHAPTWGATAYTIPTLGDPQFQSTHPRGVRHIMLIVLSCLNRFQSTHPRGVRRDVGECCACALAFQSTHPRGVRHVSKHWRDVSPLFQSTHPRGVRRRVISSYRNTCDFNPRTHVGCDADFYHLLYMDEISIHAPTWGATLRRNFFYGLDTFQSTHPRGVRPSLFDFDIMSCPISIHAPTWGATSHTPETSSSRRNFNPRTHVGCDIILTDYERFTKISIHAPTWGATQRASTYER